MQKIIMTVDDSKAVRMTIALALKQGGYQVIEASGGQEALDVLKREKVDLLISDLNMPLMDGIQLIRAIRGDESLRRLPVIMMTTEHQKGRLAEAKEAGATAWIYKPFKSDQLVAAVGKVLERFSLSS